MKRAFTFKDEKSDKFWWIDYSGNDFVINYGKTGSNGKYEIREFDSHEKCRKQALKLIEQKMKEGYTKCLDYDFFNHCYFDDEEIGPHPKTSHPNFAQHFNADFYYDCVDEESPFGNDEGADTLVYLQDHIEKDNTDLMIFPKMLIEKWGMTYVPPEKHAEADLLKLVKGDKINEIANEDLFLLNDQVIIATAFGQIKIAGEIQNGLQELAVLSLKRIISLNKLLNYSPLIFTKQMMEDLEIFPTKVISRTK